MNLRHKLNISLKLRTKSDTMEQQTCHTETEHHVKNWSFVRHINNINS
jgi:hypothetical protein